MQRAANSKFRVFFAATFVLASLICVLVANPIDEVRKCSEQYVNNYAHCLELKNDGSYKYTVEYCQRMCSGIYTHCAEKARVSANKYPPPILHWPRPSKGPTKP
jgi:hypothetical protein